MSVVGDPVPGSWQVKSSAVLLANWLLTVRVNSVRMSDEHYAKRMVVAHPGAVVVLALNASDQVLMIKQYRHPVGRELWELPAGLRDVDGESALQTARRELLEETGWKAGDWHTLVDYYTSPGFTDERIRVFLARDLTQACGNGEHGAGEHGGGRAAAQFRRQGARRGDVHRRRVGAAARGGPTGARRQTPQRPCYRGVMSGYAAWAEGFAGLRPGEAPE